MRENYYNCSAVDIVRRFMWKIKRFRTALNVIIIISYGFFIYFVLKGIYLTSILVYLFLFLTIYFIRRVHANMEIMMLDLIINRDCDPAKYADVFLTLREHRLYRDRAGISKIKIGRGYYYAGRYEEAYNILDEFKHVPKQTALALQYYLHMANCGGKLGRYELVYRAKAEINLILTGQKPNSGNAKYAKLALNIIDTVLAEKDKNYDEAIRLITTYQMTAQSNLQKVSSAYKLADIYFQSGDYDNAKSRYEFVVQNGNKLFIVDEAREKLTKL